MLPRFAATVKTSRTLAGPAWHRYAPWLAFAAIACTWFLTLDARHLLRSDEGRYAEIAREMVATGDWVTIRYDGIKYFEKPPFQMWMTALAYEAFGIGEWQARLWVAVSGALGIVMTMVAARRWFGPIVALLAGAVLLAAPGWNLGSHFNSLDMGVSGALTCVLAGVLMAQHPSASLASRRRWMLFAWASMAIAVLTKGLIGIVLPGLVLVVYTAVARDFAIWRRIHVVGGTLLMLAIAAPWFVLVSSRNPEFAQFFFVHEHWQRYLSTVHLRDGPWWYFVPLVVGGFLPWIALAPRVAVVIHDESRGAGFRPVLLLAIWAAAIFVFFSASSSKLPGYILPVFPALALLAALALERLTPSQWRRHLVGATVAVVALLAATPFLDRIATAPAQAEIYRSFATWLAKGCAIALGGLVVAWRANGSDPRASIVVYGVALFMMATVTLRGHEAVGRRSSGADLVPAIEAVAGPEVPLYSVRMLDHTLPFYLRRTPIMVDVADELEFGIAQEPGQSLPTLAAFEQRWTSGSRALALMSHETFATLREQHVPMTAVAEDDRRVVVANFETPRR
jgi:4-amino-4-deoxy-L-arabinose transferase-like glycosyltransferase